MTDTYDAGEFTLRKVREHVWELPKEDGMRAPARVLASERLLDEISEDRTLEQIRNTTHLPGIKKYAICMPDGHQGYGFPVGGVGAMDAEDGCISPGAVGYDINCVTGDAEVRIGFGRRRRIDTLSEDFEDRRAVVAADGLTSSPIRLVTETDERTVYAVETESGDRIRATADHPFLTPDGMVDLQDLTPGESVLLQPFRGLPDERPDEFTLLSPGDFADRDRQLVATLREWDLLPLKSTDENFNHLLKLIGFHTGAGGVSESGDETWFSAAAEDLETIREDIRALGFTPSNVCQFRRPCNHGEEDRESTGSTASPASKAFTLLLQRLGASGGSDAGSDGTVPGYFDRLAGWQQALYLSAYFGAEMDAPSGAGDGQLDSPGVSRELTAEQAQEGRAFLEEMANALGGLGVDAFVVEESGGGSNATDESIRLQLRVSNSAENLIRFFSTVGYRYDRQKRRDAVAAIQYLKSTLAGANRRVHVDQEPETIADGGAEPGRTRLGSAEVDERNSRTRPGDRSRLSREPAGFEQFRETTDIGEDLTIECTIRSITEVGEEPVYDIGVENDAHNFLANGFVVSNCGVRMVTTNLSYDDVRGKETELVDQLFANVPSGLGGGGVVDLDRETLDEVLERGVEWAVENGYGVEDDLLHCEDEGRRPEADPGKISTKAKDRGSNQVGSLGSGNHFLEVQRVTDIYDSTTADAFGLETDQVVVLIHCGSRGLGHQTCNDYLRKIEQRHEGLLEQLPDRELAAAPAGSRLADDYYRAMCAAINFAWVNRQLVMHRTRQVFEKVFGRSWYAMDMHLLYDVAHNIAKKETHDVEGRQRELYVHRKGATRAFPAGRPELPDVYHHVGQPIIIPGSMGAGSYVLRGGEASMAETFGSTAHGAGRTMSRTEAKDTYWGGDVQDDLREDHRVYVKAQSGATVAEEAPGVYKDVDEVVRVSDALGIGDKVARTFPVCNIKG